jgi:hypothetical protein
METIERPTLGPETRAEGITSPQVETGYRDDVGARFASPPGPSPRGPLGHAHSRPGR